MSNAALTTLSEQLEVPIDSLQTNTPISPTKFSDEGQDLSKSEQPNSIIDERFGELLEIASRSPEAQQVATNTAIEQMRLISEQMTRVRNIQQLQELKLKMLENWNQLKEVTGENPDLLQKIQQWGNRFGEEQVIYHDLIIEQADEMVEKVTDLRHSWAQMQAQLGATMGLVGNLHSSEVFSLNRLTLEKPEVDLRTGKIQVSDSLSKFEASVRDQNAGFDPEKIDTKAAVEFLTDATSAIRELSRLSTTQVNRGGKTVMPIEVYPDLSKRIAELVQMVREMSEYIKEINGMQKVAKKVRDTHFLPLYNTGDQEQ